MHVVGDGPGRREVEHQRPRQVDAEHVLEPVAQPHRAHRVQAQLGERPVGPRLPAAEHRGLAQDHVEGEPGGQPVPGDLARRRARHLGDAVDPFGRLVVRQLPAAERQQVVGVHVADHVGPVS